MNNDWLDIEVLEDYLDGKLDAKAMHKVEKQALEDPFVAQALAGLSASPKRAKESVSLLQKQLYERISQQQVQKKETVFTWQRLSVAAAAAVMFISVSILFFMRDRENREQLAKSHPKRVDVNIAPLPENSDSVQKELYAAAVPAETTTALSTIPSDVKGKIRQNEKAISTVTTSAKQQPLVIADTAGANARVATVIAPAVSAPIGGWAKFDSYLNDNNKLLTATKAEKFVELSFLIDSEGNPSDIKVEKSAEKEFDEEAIRLIKEGPKWETTKSSDTRVIYTVAF